MKRLLLFILLMAGSAAAHAQPFIDEIRAFQRQDSLQSPARRINLFVGSSSLRLWKNMQADLAPFPVLNRGFGGSTLADVIRYVPEVIYPYHPKRIVIYCGENDFAASDSVTVDTVVNRFKTLFALIRQHRPRVPVVFISIKPSPSRIHLIDKVREANARIRAYLATMRRTTFVDVFSLMVTADGKPREELFGPDRLHMNEKGYAIWREALLPVLR